MFRIASSLHTPTREHLIAKRFERKNVFLLTSATNKNKTWLHILNIGEHSASPPVAAQFSAARSFPLKKPPYINGDDVNAQEENGDSQLPASVETECFAWVPGRPKTNRLEVRAALSMSVNVLPFWLCTFPVSCQAIALYWCMRLEASCYTTIYQNSYFLRELFMIHSIYNPLMYMITSCEFRKALFHIAWKLGNEFKIKLRRGWEQSIENPSTTFRFEYGKRLSYRLLNIIRIHKIFKFYITWRSLDTRRRFK